jgi:hypothetical protein
VGDETHTRLERVLRQRNKRKTRSRPRENGGGEEERIQTGKKISEAAKVFDRRDVEHEEKKILPRR